MKKKLILASVVSLALCFAITGCKKKTTTKVTTTNKVTTTKTNTTTKNNTTTNKTTNRVTTTNKTTLHVHAYGEWQTVNEPTCTKEGSKKKECACGDVIIETINPKGHTIVDGKCSACDASPYQMIDEKSLYFGYYPQTKVTDEDVLTTLNTKAGTLPTEENAYNWSDYGYYIKGNASSYMYYIDIDLDNDSSYDYRGVYFTQYRPYGTSFSAAANTSHQDDNGYNTNTVYFFKYEPIKWNILNTIDGKALIIADLILDAQDFNYTYNSKTVDGKTIYANNYEYSHIRSWLNNDFYNTAFGILEEAIIEETLVDNSLATTTDSTNEYVCNDTLDKVFLLSAKESGPWFPNSWNRLTVGTDYAKAQGLDVSNNSSPLGCSAFLLRSPFYYADYFSYAYGCDGGGGKINYSVDLTYCGVRPVCWIKL